MADKRVIITLGCTECKNKNYHYQRGKKKDFKIEIRKFCRACGNLHCDHKYHNGYRESPNPVIPGEYHHD